MNKVVLMTTEGELDTIPLLCSWLRDNHVPVTDGPNGVSFHLTATQTDDLLEQLYQMVDQLGYMINHLTQMPEEPVELVIA